MENDDKSVNSLHILTNTNLINYNLNHNIYITNIINRVATVSNEFTHVHEDYIDIFQILTDLKFSINCYINENLQFHFYRFKNI